jgi:hypothetical protein
MRKLTILLTKIWYFVGIIFQNKIYVFAVALMLYSFYYRIAKKHNAKSTPVVRESSAWFVKSSSSDNIIHLRLKRKTIHFQLSTVDLPTNHSQRCESIIGSMVRDEIYQLLSQAKKIKVRITHHMKNIYYGDLMFDNQSLSQVLISKNLGYKIEERKKDPTKTWCSLVEIRNNKNK